MAQHGVPPGDDETFLHEVLLGHIRYAKLLRVFVDEFYGQNSGTLLRGDATLYGILALLTLLRLEEMGFAAFRKFVMSQDPQKMIVFLQYTFDVPELRKLLWGEWTRLYDRERVRALFTSLEQFLAPIGEIVSVLEEKVFLQKKKEEEKKETAEEKEQEKSKRGRNKARRDGKRRRSRRRRSRRRRRGRGRRRRRR